MKQKRSLNPMQMLKSSTLGFALVLLGLGTASCSDDPKPEEPVSAQQAVEEPAAPPPVEVEPAPEPVQTFSPETVYFAFDDYSLSSEAQASLAAMADYLNANMSVTVQVEGHCDERGSIEYNLALGDQRAQAVKQYLVNSGVDSNRVNTISFGEDRPAVDGNDESSWSQNRRAEFVVSP